MQKVRQMRDLNGTKTEQNLRDAFAGECMATNKYSYYASKARENGYQEIGDLFEETAASEREHAEIWFRVLHNDTMPATPQNLSDAAEGELYEWTEMYTRMAREAKEEGFNQLSFLFSEVAKIEKNHEERFRRLLSDLNNGLVFSREGEAVWQCMNCGHIHIGKTAPVVCPVCSHPQGYFKFCKENC